MTHIGRSANASVSAKGSNEAKLIAVFFEFAASLVVQRSDELL